MKSEHKKRLAITWSGLAVLVFLSFYFDNQLTTYISYLRTDVLTDFFLGITYVSSLLIVFLFLTAIFLKEGKRKWVPPLWISLALSVVISFLLKYSLQRDRPFQQGVVSIVQENFVSASYATWNSSFPSFQAMMVFTALPFLQKEYPKFKYVWFVFACIVALSRVYLGLHFPSDILLGGIIGYIIGFFTLRWWKEKFSL